MLRLRGSGVTVRSNRRAGAHVQLRVIPEPYPARAPPLPLDTHPAVDVDVTADPC